MAMPRGPRLVRPCWPRPAGARPRRGSGPTPRIPSRQHATTKEHDTEAQRVSLLGYHFAPVATTQSFRTHTCGELRAEHVGQRVTLAGWVHRRRDHGHLTFFDLRDRYGITQVVTSADEASAAHQAAAEARNEWVVQVSGTVRHRPEGTTNPDLPTGEGEVSVDELTVLNESKVPPFYVNEEQPGLEEVLRLHYRYLDLRRPPMRERMLLRARLASAIRRELEADDFVEVETPLLIRSTPEGARDFVV